VDSLANTFAVNGSAGWGKPADASNSVRQERLDVFGPNHSNERGAFMRDPYASKTIVNPQMPVGELLRGIALAYALCRRNGKQAYTPWEARIITRTTSQTLNA
jgi:hypothetical protein